MFYYFFSKFIHSSWKVHIIQNIWVQQKMISDMGRLGNFIFFWQRGEKGNKGVSGRPDPTPLIFYGHCMWTAPYLRGRNKVKEIISVRTKLIGKSFGIWNLRSQLWNTWWTKDKNYRTKIKALVGLLWQTLTTYKTHILSCLREFQNFQWFEEKWC